MCDRQDRVWVAWDTGGVNWGKDQGYTVRDNPRGVVLYDARQIGVKVFARGEAVVKLTALPKGIEDAKAAAWVDLCLATMNLNEFVYVK